MRGKNFQNLKEMLNQTEAQSFTKSALLKKNTYHKIPLNLINKLL